MSITSIIEEVNTLVTAFEPVISAASPTAGAAINVFQNIAQAALKGEASAATLVAQVKAGTPLTAAQIAAADNNLATALALLNADIAAANKG